MYSILAQVHFITWSNFDNNENLVYWNHNSQIFITQTYTISRMAFNNIPKSQCIFLI